MGLTAARERREGGIQPQVRPGVPLVIEAEGKSTEEVFKEVVKKVMGKGCKLEGIFPGKNGRDVVGAANETEG